MMQILDECYARKLIPKPEAADMYIKALCDNSGAIEMAKVPKLRPRTKHMNTKYHHFRDYVKQKKIQIHYVASEDQLADMLTKQPSQALFLRHRKLLLGW